MRLSTVIAGTGTAHGPLGRDPDVVRVTGDSRAVVPGALFFALPGAQRRRPRLRRRGSSPRRGGGGGRAAGRVRAGAPRSSCPPARRAMAIAAANFFGQPGRRSMKLRRRHRHQRQDHRHLPRGGLRRGGRACRPRVARAPSRTAGPAAPRPATHTTPESTELAATLAEMRDAGARLARPGGLVARAGPGARGRALASSRRRSPTSRATTSTTTATWRRTSRPSARLFAEHLAPDGVAVVNARRRARRAPRRRAARRRARTVVALRRAPDDRAVRRATPRVGLDGHRGRARDAGWRRSRLALAAGRRAQPREPARAPPAWRSRLGLAARRRWSARLAALARRARAGSSASTARGVTAFVDYAHTADALDARAARRCARSAPRRLHRRLRLRRRPRPRQAAAHGRGRRRARADLAVVTSDNPRTEDPAAILDEIVPGPGARPARRASTPRGARRGERGYRRRGRSPRGDRARRSAPAQPGDVVLIAGKGHEDYQILGTSKQPLRRPRGGAPRRSALAMSAAMTATCIAGTSSPRADRRPAASGTAARAMSRASPPTPRRSRRAALLRRAPRRALRRPRLRRRGRARRGRRRALVVARRARPPRSRRRAGRRARRGRRHARARSARSRALHRAALRDRRWSAITGSNGKTTTKELVAAILAHAAARRCKTEGNLNNEVGVPLTLLAPRAPSTQRAVVEMGMSDPGEIACLAALARARRRRRHQRRPGAPRGARLARRRRATQGRALRGAARRRHRRRQRRRRRACSRGPQACGRGVVTFGRARGRRADVAVSTSARTTPTALRLRAAASARREVDVAAPARRARTTRRTPRPRSPRRSRSAAATARSLAGLATAQPAGRRLRSSARRRRRHGARRLLQRQPARRCAPRSTTLARARRRRPARVAVLGDMLELGAAEEPRCTASSGADAAAARATCSPPSGRARRPPGEAARAAASGRRRRSTPRTRAALVALVKQRLAPGDVGPGQGLPRHAARARRRALARRLTLGGS